MSSKIFISYRRADSLRVGWLCEKLYQQFNRNEIFLDQNSIGPGHLWAQKIDRALAEAAVFLLVIEADWEEELRKRAAAREKDPAYQDVLLHEVRKALARSERGELVIFPLLFDRAGSEVPIGGLDASFKALAASNTFSFGHSIGDELDDRLQRLLPQISRVPGAPQPLWDQGSGTLPEPLDRERGKYRGHEKLLTAIGAALTHPRPDDGDRSLALFGLPGIGKSTVAKLLFHDDAIRAEFPDAQLWAQLGPNADRRLALLRLRSWATKLGASREELATLVDPIDIKALIVDKLRGRRVLFVVDDVWEPGIGKLLSLVSPDCATVFTTRTESIARRFVDDFETQVFQVPKLDLQTSLEVLRLISPASFKLGEQITGRIEAVARKYDGVPKALDIIGAALREAGGVREDVMNRLDHFRADDLNGLIRDSALQLSETHFQALCRLSALHPDPDSFSGALASSVSGLQGEGLRTLVATGLLQRFEASSAYTVDDKEDAGRYRIHQTVADCLSAELTVTEKNEVYQRAAVYFDERLTKLEEGEAQASYAAWRRHDDPRWQRAMYGLRYYLAKSGDYDSAAFLLTKAWIFGFWWWCVFTDDGFDYCDELLRDWPEAAPGTEASWSQDLADLLTIKREYPRERDPDRLQRREQWLAVRGSLERLACRRELRGELAHFDNPHCDLRGMISLLLAETYHFGEGRFDEALRFYEDAELAFERPFAADPDLWNLSWALHHKALCLRDMQRVDEARDACVLAIRAEFEKPDGDLEILARLFCLCAEMAAAQGQAQIAARCYHNAVYYAYRFQVYLDLNEPAEPDAYTVSHYEYMVKDVVAGIAALRQTRGGAKTAELILRELAARWAKPSAAALTTAAMVPAATLFPRPFPAAQLSDEAAAAAYAAEVRRELESLAPEPSQALIDAMAGS